jgi:anthranilate phosphoribosyltransferase
MFIPLLGRLAAGENLSPAETTAAIDAIMDGRIAHEQIALFLTALHAKGETVDELVGAAVAMRNQMVRSRTRHPNVVDTCGTGGVGSKLFNISTAAALVTAAAGVPVAKHGNRAVTSRTGSADVLSALGVNIQAEMNCVERCLDELGICFCFAPVAHPSMKRVAEVRRRLGFPTIFNLLGPLCNPAGAPFQLLGVGRDELLTTMARALAMLGTRRSVVVNGEGGLGEVTTVGETRVTEVTGEKTIDHRWTAADFGLAPAASVAPLEIENASQSAALIRSILDGRPGPARDMVVANSAAALWIAGESNDLPSAARRAQQAIDSGAALKLLNRLVEFTNRN